MTPRTLLSLALALSACAGPETRRFEYERPSMGTIFRIVLYAEDAEDADRAADAALTRVEELDRILSDWDPESELSRLSARSAGGVPPEPIEVGPDLWAVLVDARRISEATAGAFDVTVGPYVRLWRRSVRQGELPSEARLAEARAAVGWEKLALHPERRAVELMAADMRLDLGAIGKGYALDAALDVLRARGLERALVVGGGDILAGDPPPGRDGWRIQVQPHGAADGSESALILANEAVATSGDVEQYVVIEGRRFAHIVSPFTGLGLERPTSATVIGPTGARADALATAACVLGGERAPDALDWTGPLGLLIVEDSSGLPWRSVSGGFSARIPWSAP